MCMGVRPPVTTAVHHSAAALKGSRKIKNEITWLIDLTEDWDTDETFALKRT